MPETAVANRRAALLAHAMAEPDREWLLAELSAPQRHVLRSLLEELRSMRVPRDAALVRQLLDAEAAGSPERSLFELPASGIPLLVQVLRGEPPAIAAILLQARDWPWRETVLDQLDPGVRRTAGAQAATVQAPRLRQAVIASVWRAIERKRAVPVGARGRVPQWIQVLRGGKAA